MLAVDKRSGEEVWRHDTKVWSYSSPLVLGNHLLSATMKGELVWQYQTLYSYMEYVTHQGVFLSSPAWHNDQLIITSTNGELLVFSAGQAQ